MKNKLTYLVAAFLCGSCLAHASADEQPPQDSYSYVSFGSGPINGLGDSLLVPNLSVGYRSRGNSIMGSDTGLSFSTIGTAHQVSLQYIMHFYLNPYDSSSPYLGTGLRMSGFFANQGRAAKAMLSTDFVVGKSLEDNFGKGHFVEMHVCSPSVWICNENSQVAKKKGFTAVPMMYLTYGMGF